MKTEVFEMEWPGTGRLGMMARPHGGEWLDDALKALRGNGVDLLVNALTEEDRERLDLRHEPTAAREVGLDYVSFPITDFGVPKERDLKDLAAKLAEAYEEGSFVVAHCFGGSGRSGLIVGATLIKLGATAEEAMELMAKARGFRAPETDEQREMLRRI
jgi:protein-tyrosine phosphatase